MDDMNVRAGRRINKIWCEYIITLLFHITAHPWIGTYSSFTDTKTMFKDLTTGLTT